MNQMNKIKKNIKLIFVFFSCLFLSLIIYLSYFTIYESENLIQSSYNRRLWEQEARVIRGTIYDRNGKPLAESVVEGETKSRIYSGGKAFGPLIGYTDRKLGRAGLEDILNAELLGISEKDAMVLLRQKILGVSEKGNDVYITIDMDLQKTAYELFYGKKGACVALDPRTGEILALVSSPGYDSAKITKDWDKISQDKSGPLLNRATQGLYPPGSSFKVVTAAAALTSNPDIDKKVYYTPGYVKVKGKVIRDYEGFQPGNYDLKNAFRKSSNTVFIKIGQEIGKDIFFSTAEGFGFNKEEKFDIPVAKSNLPPPPVVGGEVELASDFIGQGRILVTPFQMARTVSIIANGGQEVKPYLIKKSVSPLGKVKLYNQSKPTQQIIDRAVAEKINSFMVDVVQNGTGYPARIRGVNVAGKTGSAENPHGKAHAWFIGFAPAEDPKIAVAVIVENAGGGGSNAGPIARDVIMQYLRSKKQL